MKYHQIDRDLFIKNRSKFMAQMKPKSVACFNSNDIYPIGADSTMPFEQSRDIFYLSGVDQEESILLLFPDALTNTKRNIISKRNKRPYSRLGR
jgi:Xaa-Pro aminopeptidase